MNNLIRIFWGLGLHPGHSSPEYRLCIRFVKKASFVRRSPTSVEHFYDISPRLACSRIPKRPFSSCQACHLILDVLVFFLLSHCVKATTKLVCHLSRTNRDPQATPVNKRFLVTLLRIMFRSEHCSKYVPFWYLALTSRSISPFLVAR